MSPPHAGVVADLLGRVQRAALRRLATVGRRRPASRSAAPAPPDLSCAVRRVLVTGAGGRVATLVLPWLRRDGLELACVDRRGVGGVPATGAVQRADLRSAAAADRLVRGHDAIVHLAAVATEACVEDLLPDNVLALSHLLEAAARHGAGRFVFASSMHVVGMYDRDQPVDESSPPRPDSHYAASKVHGEALCRLYAERHAMAVTCLRLGSVTATLEEAEPANWIGPQDVAQMVEIALRRERPGLEIFHAVADYEGSPLPASRAAAFGYRCRQPAEPWAVALARVARTWRDDPVARRKRGATFASGRTGG
ncbi:MAG: NAD(P)-dependent oxidoreductase [Steroidobacteraceae bacterium]|jgi:uronate dehydrogenase|nr:NAD(P)-dependent oxidoreductase [Steroidobacteraceae bacterium]